MSGFGPLEKLFQNICVVLPGWVRLMRWSRGCIQYKKVRGTEVVVLLTDSHVNMIVNSARRSRGVTCSHPESAARGVGYLTCEVPKKSYYEQRCAFNQVCRLTDIVRQLAKSSCPSPRLEFSTFSVPCEPFLPCLKLSQEWQAKHNENYRKSPSSKFEVWCKTFLANDQISSCFSSRRG